MRRCERTLLEQPDEHDGLTAIEVRLAGNESFRAYEMEQDMPYEIGDLYELGEQYMIGDATYMIGAPAGAMPVPYRAPMQLGNRGGLMVQPQAVPVVQMPRPTLVRKKDPSESKLQPLGCNVETNIVVGATGTAIASPQKIFKPERYIVPDTVAPDFLIDGIFVGVDRQSPAIGAIPAEAFGPNAIYANIEFATCQISMQISVQARNRGGADRPFFSCFYGRTVS